jgi:predicted HicB family RNase H-like nuclease
MSKDKQDNLESAMNSTADIIEHTISTSLGADGPAEKQILIRASSEDHERWKAAAQREGKSLAQFIRETMNGEVVSILDCTHPINMRRYYPWAEFCLKCNQRLRG